MKTCLLLLLATFALVACEDEFGSIDELSPAEFEQYLDSGEGLNFLVKLAQGKEIDFQAIENKLETTHTLKVLTHFYYYYQDGKWSKGWVSGNVVTHYTTFPDNSVIRECFKVTFDPDFGWYNFFRDASFEGTVFEYILTEEVSRMTECKVIAQLNETTFVIEGFSNERLERKIVILDENRAEILAKYTDPYPC